MTYQRTIRLKTPESVKTPQEKPFHYVFPDKQRYWANGARKKSRRKIMKPPKQQSVRRNLGELMKECTKKRYTIEVHILITEEMAEQIIQAAGNQHKTQSDAVRYIIEQGLKHLRLK